MLDGFDNAVQFRVRIHQIYSNCGHDVARTDPGRHFDGPTQRVKYRVRATSNFDIVQTGPNSSGPIASGFDDRNCIWTRAIRTRVDTRQQCALAISPDANIWPM